MRSMIRIWGQDNTKALIAMFITEADMMCGGKCAPEAIAMFAGMCLEKFKHRSVASVLMAIRDGITYSDEDGKVYAAITWPKISLWLDRFEEKVLNMAHSEHSANVVKGDNYDGRYLDALEREDPKKRLEQKDRLIDQLRKKLETKKS